jgi:hypothetical protein
MIEAMNRDQYVLIRVISLGGGGGGPHIADKQNDGGYITWVIFLHSVGISQHMLPQTTQHYPCSDTEGNVNSSNRRIKLR